MIDQEITAALTALIQLKSLTDQEICVFGVSTSEVQGEKIGSVGSVEIAQRLFQGVMRVQKQHGFHPAFQCCEHLNRALIVTRSVANRFGLVEVAAIPTPEAGGAMAAYAYRHLSEAVCVESLQADAGIDIGDTLIGMHLKPVAVPVRSTQTEIGQAHLKMAYTRPKYIGGVRTLYDQQ